MIKTPKSTEEYLSEIKAINDEKEQVDKALSELVKLGKSVYQVDLNKEMFTVPFAVGDEVALVLRRYYERRWDELIEKATHLIRQQQ
jgi:hypothetical protein